MSGAEERYADTGRAVGEQVGGHAVLWIVEDAQAWAAAIEAEGDRQVGLWPRSSRYIGEHRRREAYASAAQVREQGAYRSVRQLLHTAGRAEAVVADLRRSHPNPGVRYEVAAVEEVDGCPTAHCRQPRILVDGRWWHNLGGFPSDCAAPPAPPEPEPEPVDGEFVVDVGAGTMRCGWCSTVAHWAEAALGYTRLTGFHVLGVQRETNVLVVLAEATALSGATVHLPHHCPAIPEDVHARFAPGTVLFR